MVNKRIRIYFAELGLSVRQRTYKYHRQLDAAETVLETIASAVVPRKCWALAFFAYTGNYSSVNALLGTEPRTTVTLRQSVNSN